MRNAPRVLALVALLASPAVSATADDGDTLITDPVLLTRLGFSPEARHVYLAKGAVMGQKNSLAQPQEFGTVDFGYTTVLGNQHHPLGSDTEYLADVTGAGQVSHISGNPQYDAQLHIPSGALLKQVTFFLADNAPTAYLEGDVVRVCQTESPTVGPPVVTVLGTGQSNDGDASFTISVPPGEAVSNLSCAYVARSTFVGTPPFNVLLRKVRAAWQRQVSPAPAIATFPNDTPTTHPYFRFIEALAAAGITGGCAPGSYCPNSPITRGEMAVFLSVALGLHFTN